MFLRGGNGLNRSFTKKYQVMQSDIILFVKSFKYMHKREEMVRIVVRRYFFDSERACPETVKDCLSIVTPH